MPRVTLSPSPRFTSSSLSLSLAFLLYQASRRVVRSPGREGRGEGPTAGDRRRGGGGGGGGDAGVGRLGGGQRHRGRRPCGPPPGTSPRPPSSGRSRTSSSTATPSCSSPSCRRSTTLVAGCRGGATASERGSGLWRAAGAGRRSGQRAEPAERSGGRALARGCRGRHRPRPAAAAPPPLALGRSVGWPEEVGERAAADGVERSSSGRALARGCRGRHRPRPAAAAPPPLALGRSVGWPEEVGERAAADGVERSSSGRARAAGEHCIERATGRAERRRRQASARPASKRPRASRWTFSSLSSPRRPPLDPLASSLLYGRRRHRHRVACRWPPTPVRLHVRRGATAGPG
ncbi:hapless 2-like isoform X2 [Oryza glaberrima]|uniref:hapless 2-like isoform X2 n=1 Tax=Oryza glaberrima TaxID=4538 RepID=UPI00224C3334|nr:hapless 2-like isoform X2 [Oryza glaberrima]